MSNVLRTLSVAALLVALTPLAFAQGAVSNAADVAPTGAVQVFDFMPLPAPVPENTECYNNGPLFNSPGTHGGGLDESILVGDENLFGWGAQGGTVNNRMADDYVAQAGCTNLKGAVFYKYQTGATAPSINGVDLQVYGSDGSGMPDTGNVVCSSSTLAGAVTFTNTFRVTTAGGDSQRRLQRVAVDFPSGCTLTVGQRYWFGIESVGTLASGPWQPPVPRPLGATTCPGPTNGMGAKQSIAGAAFAPAFTNGVDCQSDMPFALLGADEPECDIKFLASDITYDSGTRRLCVIVTVRNNGTGPRGARLELDFNRMGGNPQGTRVLGSGSIPGGVQVTRTVCLTVPAAAPDGNYNFTLRLVDPATGNDCSVYQETIAISAPRLPGDAADGALFEVEEAADFSASASATTGTGVAVAPNPFARQTTVSYEVASAADVRLAVYDVLGREVAVLVDGRMEAGSHSAVFNASDLAAGTYVYRLVVGNDVQTGRMTLAY
jgi:hypothetical protein